MENVGTNQSANKVWKDSGTTLSFKEWISREKEKGMVIPNNIASDSLASIKQSLGIDKVVVDSQPLPNKNLVLGLNKWVLIGSLVVIGSAVAYGVYKKRK